MNLGQAEPPAFDISQPHLVGLDIDGTLLVTHQHPRPAVLASLRAARHAGHELVLATGRSLTGALQAAHDLELMSGWIIASNGSVVAKMTNGDYEVTEFHEVNARSVVDYVTAVRPNLKIAAEILGVGYHVSRLFPEGELPGQQVQVARPGDLWVEPTPRMVVYGDNAQHIVPTIRAGGMTATRTRPDWVDITPGHVTKATALEALRQQLGIPKNRTVAIGDSENDIPMFMWAELSYAMGHASDIVRFTAKYGTKAVEDDGAAFILRSLAGLGAPSPTLAERHTHRFPVQHPAGPAHLLTEGGSRN